MARIHTYKTSLNISPEDKVIGSDVNENNKTKNYPIGSIIQQIQDQVNNDLPKIISVVLDEAETIDSALESINITVNASDRPVLISFFKPTTTTGSIGTSQEYAKILYLFPLGNGVYEPISDFLNFQDLVLLNVSKPSLADVGFLSNSTQIDLGDITGSTPSDVLNNKLPSVDLSDTESTYVFSFIDDGVAYFSIFTGDAGVYGLNDLQSTQNDFTDFTNSETLFFEQDTDVKALNIEVDLSEDYFETDEEELDDVVAKVNSLPTFIIEQNFYGLISADLDYNGVAYSNKYLITRGKGTYGENGFQISNTESNIIKIYDGFRSKDLSNFDNSNSQFLTESDLDYPEVPENVSEFNNDAGYATEKYVDDSVSFRGVFNDKQQIQNITDPSNGDYVILLAKSNVVRQKWVFFNGAWNQKTAIRFFEEVNLNTSLNYKYHNSVIRFTGNVTEVALDDQEQGSSIVLRNQTNNVITVNSSGSTVLRKSINPSESILYYFDKINNTFRDLSLSSGGSFGALTIDQVLSEGDTTERVIRFQNGDFIIGTENFDIVKLAELLSIQFGNHLVNLSSEKLDKDVKVHLPNKNDSVLSVNPDTNLPSVKVNKTEWRNLHSPNSVFVDFSGANSGGTYNVTDEDYVIRFESSSSGELSLPLASEHPNREIVVSVTRFGNIFINRDIIGLLGVLEYEANITSIDVGAGALSLTIKSINNQWQIIHQSSFQSN